MRVTPNAWCNGYNAMSVMAVVQFGLAMMPLCHFTSAELISGMTSGTLSSWRNALELSTTTQFCRAAIGANSFEMPPPALNNATSIPLNPSALSSWTRTSSPLNFSFLPTERAEASKVNLLTGKLRFSSVLIISMPTAPVAPTTATCGFRFITKGRQYIGRQMRVKRRAEHAGIARETALGESHAMSPQFSLEHIGLAAQDTTAL